MKENVTIKMTLLGALVTALLASSAMAQSYDPDQGSGNIVQGTDQSPVGPAEPYVGPSRARAYAPESRALSARAYAYQPRHHLHNRTMQGHSDMDRE